MLFRTGDPNPDPDGRDAEGRTSFLNGVTKAFDPLDGPPPPVWRGVMPSDRCGVPTLDGVLVLIRDVGVCGWSRDGVERAGRENAGVDGAG